jgi:signal transduction histidine kinase
MLTIICYFQYQREKEFRAEQLDQELTIYNYTIHKFIKERNATWDELEDYVHLFPDSALRVTVIDSAGFVTFDSSVNNGTRLDNHLQRPEIEMANTSENGKAIRHSLSMGKDYYYLAHRFPSMYVRSALPYNVSLTSMLKANLLFLNFMVLLLLSSVLALYLVARKFTKSIDRLRLFIQKAENDDIPDMEIEFPTDELGEISKNIVKLYKLQVETKAEVNKEREKLIMHLQISQEGLGIFSSDKKEILANAHFVQYTNILANRECEYSDQIFTLPEFAEMNEFIDNSLHHNKLDKKRLTIQKRASIFAVQCIVFQDNTFEVSINDISVQEHENELKRQLTQNISHELKTPVSSILGYMESILNNPELDKARQRFFIERSFQQALRLSSLLQDISMLNKMDESKRLFEKESCNILTIISDVMNDMHLEIEQKACLISTKVDASIEIQGNRSLLYSIFRNLTDNALAYGGERLTIEINCFRQDERFYYFSFTDNGIGVGEEHLSRLFERFYRVDKGRSRKVGGTGLGLAIVKNAVLYHQGNISAKNVDTGGLSFIFSFRKK